MKTLNGMDQTMMDKIMQSEQYIKEIANTIQTEEIKKLIDFAMNKPIWLANFNSVPVTVKEHHNYYGGLLVHTAEVLKGVVQLAKFKDLNEYETDLLIAAAILHDFGAVYENIVYPEMIDGEWTVQIAKSDLCKYDRNNLFGYTVRLMYTGHLLSEFYNEYRDEVNSNTVTSIEVIIKSKDGIANWNASSHSVFCNKYASTKEADELSLFLFLANLHSKMNNANESILREMESESDADERKIIRDMMPELKEMWSQLDKATS